MIVPEAKVRRAILRQSKTQKLGTQLRLAALMLIIPWLSRFWLVLRELISS
jgi:hypothetical protein